MTIWVTGGKLGGDESLSKITDVPLEQGKHSVHKDYYYSLWWWDLRGN